MHDLRHNELSIRVDFVHNLRVIQHSPADEGTLEPGSTVKRIEDAPVPGFMLRRHKEKKPEVAEPESI